MNEAKNDSEIRSTPLGNIALTFSGGGFRSTAFSLGAISYLDQVIISKDGQSGNDISLLKNVSYISSASGGNFTNAIYSSYIHQGKTFEDVYNKLKKEIAGEKLLELAIEILADDAQWDQTVPGKQRNVINAFAKAYDKIFFDGETFGVFWNKEHVSEFEVCFNTTEFYRGLSFRFQTEGNDNPNQVIGNKYLYFDTRHIDTIKKIKIADIVAAATCFPGGFEVIAYPNDFSYTTNKQALTIEELQKAMIHENYKEEKSTVTKPYAFLDGGITDNQGLFSAMLADKKRRNRKDPDPFDLVIVTDVTSYFMDDYVVPVEKNNPSWRNRKVNFYLDIIKTGISKFVMSTKLLITIISLMFLAGFAGIIFSESKFLAIVSGFVCGVSILALLLIYVVKRIAPIKWIFKNKEKIKKDQFITDWTKEQKILPEKIMKSFINFFKFSRIGLLEQLLKVRITSMQSLLLDVNLKHTRRLIYDLFYEQPIWDNRRMPNFIYELSTYNVASRTNRFNSPDRLTWVATEDDKILFLSNCGALNKVAEEARTTSTTMWFDEKDTKNQRLKKIIATGQFTTCCNLLEYFISLERKGIQFEENTNKQLEEIKTMLKIDFIRFKEDPFYLFNKLEK